MTAEPGSGSRPALQGDVVPGSLGDVLPGSEGDVPPGSQGEVPPGSEGDVLPGVRLGHWTDPAARTGCTVVLLPAGTVASGEVRGGAPGTREWALLAPERTVARVDGVLLSGGSAFGLAAADGVVRWCEERGIGFPTSFGPVPIVVAAVLFDLDVGDGSRRPGPAEGHAACMAATPWPAEPCALREGAGTGAMVGRGRGAAGSRPGGIGVVTRSEGALAVGAVVAVNAVGDLYAGAAASDGDGGGGTGVPPVPEAGFGATTIGVVVTNARLDKAGCFLVAQSGHDGMARALEPVHTRADGDALVAAATGEVEAPLDRVRVLAGAAVEAAIRLAAG